MTYYYQFKEFT